MEQIHIPLLLVLITFLLLLSPTTPRPTPNSFITKLCNKTKYTTLCLDSLSSSSDSLSTPTQLTSTFLNLSLVAAKTATSSLKEIKSRDGLKDREKEVMVDCVENVETALYHISKARKELNLLDEEQVEDGVLHEHNLQTLVSAALTGDITCLDGFVEEEMEGDLKRDVEKRLENVIQLTSITLVFINDLLPSNATMGGRSNATTGGC